MFKGMGGMTGMLQKAQEVKKNMQLAKESIKNIQISSQNSNVIITMNGDYQIVNLEILDNNNLELAIKNAVNDCTKQIKTLIDAKLKDATGGIDLPF